MTKRLSRAAVEQRGGVALAGHVAAQAGRELVEDRGAEQELLHVGGLAVEDLRSEVAGDLTPVAAQPREEVRPGSRRRQERERSDERIAGRRGQFCHRFDVATGDGVTHGALAVPVDLIPGRRAPVQVVHRLRRAALELGAQQLGEQVVVAIPGVVIVERGHEEAVASQSVELAGGVGLAGHRVTQAGGELVENRGAEQKLLHIGGLAVEDLRGEVVGDLTSVAAQAREDVPGRAAIAGQEGEVDPGRPSLGDAKQIVQFVVTGFAAVEAEYRAGLL